MKPPPGDDIDTTSIAGLLDEFSIAVRLNILYKTEGR